MSVTAISFLPESRDHLLLTASESDASVKVWDIRSIANKRRGHVALSQTKHPESHSQFRHFGISSLNVNEAGTRLYTLCKDNTVYAYSTAHLILGHAPELVVGDPGSHFAPKETKEGLGPIYGFRHPQFHATSFYVKSALRKAKDGKSEMLAVGSSDGCAVLFPTDERYLSTHGPPVGSRDVPIVRSAPNAPGNPGLRRIGGGLGHKVVDGLLRSTNGTALVRGHDREVGSVCWSHDGELITVGDDYFVRCWREDKDAARDIRMNGEAGGRRHAWGWADVEEEYDREED
jgi:WD40 repeat protein